MLTSRRSGTSEAWRAKASGTRATRGQGGPRRAAGGAAPGFPERKAASAKSGPLAPRTSGPLMALFHATRSAARGRVLLHLIRDRDVAGIRGGLEVGIRFRLLWPGATDRHDERKQTDTQDKTHERNSSKVKRLLLQQRRLRNGPEPSHHECSPCQRQGHQTVAQYSGRCLSAIPLRAHHDG